MKRNNSSLFTIVGKSSQSRKVRRSLDMRKTDLSETGKLSDERIEEAAILDGDHLFTVPRPGRHHHVMLHMHEHHGYEYIRNVLQGFTTTSGRFVERIEAHRIAKAAGQLIPRAGGYAKGEVNDQDGNHLFSEDVW